MSTRSERACMLCGVVQTFRQFVNNGCPNCDEVLGLAGDEAAVQECTSPAFEGLVALGEPHESWVAKWLRISEFGPGLYAVKVNGKLPRDVIADLEAKGVPYRPRDGSATD